MVGSSRLSDRGDRRQAALTLLDGGLLSLVRQELVQLLLIGIAELGNIELLVHFASWNLQEM